MSEQIRRSEEILERHVAQLMEHFDAVQIMASRVTTTGGTEGVRRGGGNWYARRGMAQEFIERDQGQNATDGARFTSLDDGDDDDNWTPSI